MPYHVSTFSGDAAHPINCMGDCVTGDQIAFERSSFGGSLLRPVFLGFELVVGTIVADSYGAAKQQHTFTLELADGTKTRIKGRNLYANGVYRAAWPDEAARAQALIAKHERSENARSQQAKRIEEKHANFQH